MRTFLQMQCGECGKRETVLECGTRHRAWSELVTQAVRPDWSSIAGTGLLSRPSGALLCPECTDKLDWKQ